MASSTPNVLSPPYPLPQGNVVVVPTTAGQLDASGIIYHTLDLQADYGNASTSFVYIGSKASQVIELPPGGTASLSDVSPNNVWIKGSVAGLTLRWIGHGFHESDEVFR